MVSDLLVNRYIPSLKADRDEAALSLPSGIDLSKVLETNTIGSDLSGTLDSAKVLRGESEVEVPVETNIEEDPEDFESQNFQAYSPDVYLREEQIKSAGFVSAYLENEAHDDQLFKNIFLRDISGMEMSKTVIRTEDEMLAKVYVIKPEIGTERDELYNEIRSRASQNINSEVNETNSFADGSFYLNDSTRASTVFLTVKIGNLIYAFSYPKNYHGQIVNLIKLLEWELS